MIYAKNQDAYQYKGINPYLDRVLDLVSDPEFLKSLPTGEKIVVDGENIFINVNEYETRELKDAIFEYHRKYIDVQLLLEGEEEIGIASPEALEVFDQNGDFWGCKGTPDQRVILFPGSFAVLFPEDAHRCGVEVHGITHVKKVVFKVLA